jgi:ribosome-binding protein aMBF1 (putative translation factor)
LKKDRTDISLDEVFSGDERDPVFRAAFAEADLEIQLAFQIARARARAGLSQGELAKAIGTTQSVVSRIERGGQNLTLGTLRKIAVALHGVLRVEIRSNRRAKFA